LTTRAAKLGAIPLRDVAVVLSAYAALLHDWLLPDHYLEWWGYGLYFLVAGVAQAFCAGLLLLWPRRWVFLVGILGNSSILLLYTVTRTLGVPFFGPAAWQVESVGMLDLLTAAAELALVLVLVKLVRGGPRVRPAVLATRILRHPEDIRATADDF
jgi:hypothetical protein